MSEPFDPGPVFASGPGEARTLHEMLAEISAASEQIGKLQARRDYLIDCVKFFTDNPPF